jgi:hypothetical protein
VRKYEKMTRIAEGERVEAKTSPPKLQDPPSPATLKRKRKRASEALGNGDMDAAVPPPSSDSAGPVAHHRRKIGHGGTMEGRALSPLRQVESDPDGDVSDEPLHHDRGPMSPPLVRAHHHHQAPQLHTQPQGQHVGKQASLAIGRTGSLHIAPPEKSGAKPEAKDMGDALKGLTVHIIHVKDTLSDGPDHGEVILSQLREGAKESGLGCEFNVTSCGESIWV